MELRRNLWTLLTIIAAVGCYDRIPRGANPDGTAAPVQSEAAKSKPKPDQADEAAQVDESDDSVEVAADGGRPLDTGLTCEKGGSVAALRVEFTCRSVTVFTCKDLSNLVIEFEDGTRQKFDGQSGHVNDFSGTGANAGKRIVRVWVKAGANHSGDGPGYGQRVETTVSECPPPPVGGSGGTGGCVAGPDAPCGEVPGGSGGAGGCVAGPDMPCGDLPSAGIGGNGGRGGTGGSGDGDPMGPE
ncbi:MAG TPA: hypothetical protein VJV78_19285 [Polyangiales bacterium]|nr:hypothetical protein [Polyangiales bacterium]